MNNSTVTVTGLTDRTVSGNDEITFSVAQVSGPGGDSNGFLRFTFEENRKAAGGGPSQVATKLLVLTDLMGDTGVALDKDTVTELYDATEAAWSDPAKHAGFTYTFPRAQQGGKRKARKTKRSQRKRKNRKAKRQSRKGHAQ